MPQSGNPAAKNIVEHDHRIILTVDDPRNNASYRRSHPNVIFQGHSRPSVRIPSDHHPARRHQHTTSILPLTSMAAQSHTTVQSYNNAQQISLNENANGIGQSNSTESNENSGDFLFHEVIGESYDMNSDFNYYEVDTISQGSPQSGLSLDESSDSSFVPSNLNIGVNPEVQTSSLDGIATYRAAITFSTDIPAEDYEVRIIKL